jgi:hypothetical protein
MKFKFSNYGRMNVAKDFGGFRFELLSCENDGGRVGEDSFGN